MRKQRLTWAVLLGTPTALELWAVATDRTPWTLSCVTRDVLRTNCDAGRVTFLAAWAALTLWFVPHICRQAAIESTLIGDPRDAPTSGGLTTT